MRKASRGAKNLEKKIDELKSSDAEKLQSEYTKLVEGLKATEEARDEDLIMSNPVLPQDLLTGAYFTTLKRYHLTKPQRLFRETYDVLSISSLFCRGSYNIS